MLTPTLLLNSKGDVFVFFVHHCVCAMCNVCNYITCACVVRLFIVEGSLEVKLPTVWTDEKQSREEAERRERLEERRVEEKESEERRCRCVKR